jgi:hypothetical protein
MARYSVQGAEDVERLELGSSKPAYMLGWPAPVSCGKGLELQVLGPVVGGTLQQP